MFLFFVITTVVILGNQCHADVNHNLLYNLTLSALGPILDVRIEF